MSTLGLVWIIIFMVLIITAAEIIVLDKIFNLDERLKRPGYINKALAILLMLVFAWVSVSLVDRFSGWIGLMQ